MTTTYTISVENKRGADTNYGVFMDPPEFEGGTQPWMNVWYTSFVPYNANFEIKTGIDSYAWVGTTQTRPAPGVVINSGMNQPARLGTTESEGSTFNMAIKQSFPTIQETTPAGKLGAYEIRTGTDFNVPNETYLLGLAKVNNRGQVAPVASMAPLNNMRVSVKPKIRFFVSESHQLAGEIVDYTSVSNNAAEIDFSNGPGLGMTYARVIQDNTGTFDVKYYPSY